MQQHLLQHMLKHIFIISIIEIVRKMYNTNGETTIMPMIRVINNFLFYGTILACRYIEKDCV